MGIYLFNMDALVDMLNSPHDDFGSDVLPAAIESKRTYGYAFNDYWVDIGTITAFFEANLALAQPDPLFSFHDVDCPIFTHPRFLPGSRIYDVQFDRVMLADGCIVEGAEIHNSVIGIRSIIGDDVILEDTVMMGADYYESETRSPPSDAPQSVLAEALESRVRSSIRMPASDLPS
jgi:glucose-1-phosphate adenylyltransferase